MERTFIFIGDHPLSIETYCYLCTNAREYCKSYKHGTEIQHQHFISILGGGEIELSSVHFRLSCGHHVTTPLNLYQVSITNGSNNHNYTSFDRSLFWRCPCSSVFFCLFDMIFFQDCQDALLVRTSTKQ